MEFSPFPWFRFGLLFFMSLTLLITLSLGVLNHVQKGNRVLSWMIPISTVFFLLELVAFQSLNCVDSTAMIESLRIRFWLVMLMLVLMCGFFDAYNQDRSTRFFQILSLVLLLPMGLYFISAQSILQPSLILRSMPWGEKVSTYQGTTGPGFVVYYLAFNLIFWGGLFHTLRQIWKRPKNKKYMILAIAISLPCLAALIEFKKASTWGIPTMPFAYASFLVVLFLPLLDELAHSRRLSQELSFKEQQLRDMALQIPGVLYSLLVLPNGGHRFVFLSSRCNEILGFPPDHPDPIGAFLAGLSPEDQIRYAASEKESIENLSPWNFTSLFMRPDGKRIWIQGLSQITACSAGVQSNGVIFDITDKKEQEFERESMLREISLRKDELEGILASLSHDLRGPLLNISGFNQELRYLLQETEYWTSQSKEECLSQLTVVDHNAQKMVSMINMLLFVGRHSRDNLHLGKVSIRQVLSEVLSELSVAKGSEIDISLDLPTCKADPQALAIVFRKVLENSLQYHSPDRKLWIQIDAVSSHSLCSIRIRDNGIGFDPLQRERIFGAFVQLDPNASRMGMGLTLARLLLRRMGGNISTEGIPGVGSTILIDLPAA